MASRNVLDERGRAVRKKFGQQVDKAQRSLFNTGPLAVNPKNKARGALRENQKSRVKGGTTGGLSSGPSPRPTNIRNSAAHRSTPSVRRASSTNGRENVGLLPNTLNVNRSASGREGVGLGAESPMIAEQRTGFTGNNPVFRGTTPEAAIATLRRGAANGVGSFARSADGQSVIGGFFGDGRSIRDTLRAEQVQAAQAAQQQRQAGSLRSRLEQTVAQTPTLDNIGNIKFARQRLLQGDRDASLRDIEASRSRDRALDRGLDAQIAGERAFDRTERRKMELAKYGREFSDAERQSIIDRETATADATRAFIDSRFSTEFQDDDDAARVEANRNEFLGLIASTIDTEDTYNGDPLSVLDTNDASALYKLYELQKKMSSRDPGIFGGKARKPNNLADIFENFLGPDVGFFVVGNNVIRRDNKGGTDSVDITPDDVNFIEQFKTDPSLISMMEKILGPEGAARFRQRLDPTGVTNQNL